jgi:endonuclease/exonuclease/phosphatase family metal-dependent hydrolase
LKSTDTNMTLRVLTLNTWKCDGSYRERLDKMAVALGRLSPDVVLLQEVFSTTDGVADTARYLASELTMTVVNAPARRKARWFDGRMTESSSGLAVLTRLAVDTQHILQLPSDEADGQRIAQVLRLSAQGMAMWVANLHLTHLPNGSALRGKQLATVMNALTRLAGNEPALLGGDFNAGPGDPEFDDLLRAPWNLVNPFASQTKSTHCTTGGSELDLDHLLLMGWPAGVISSASVTLHPRNNSGCPASDHAAVMLELDATTV